MSAALRPPVDDASWNSSTSLLAISRRIQACTVDLGRPVFWARSVRDCGPWESSARRMESFERASVSDELLGAAIELRVIVSMYSAFCGCLTHSNSCLFDTYPSLSEQSLK